VHASGCIRLVLVCMSAVDSKKAVFIETTYLRCIEAYNCSFTHSYPTDGVECLALLSGRFVSEKRHQHWTGGTIYADIKNGCILFIYLFIVSILICFGLPSNVPKIVTILPPSSLNNTSVMYNYFVTKPPMFQLCRNI